MNVGSKLYKEIELNKFWVLRGVKVKDNGTKEVVDEARFEYQPNEQDIAKFLINCKECDFCSVVENYSLAELSKDNLIAERV